MGFVGFNSSFCTVLCAEMAANWLVRYADSQLAKQPTADEMHKNIDMMLHFKRVERPAASVYGGLCVAPYHFKHFDELLDDMGAPSAAAIHWQKNLLRPMPTSTPDSWRRLPTIGFSHRKFASRRQGRSSPQRRNSSSGGVN